MPSQPLAQVFSNVWASVILHSKLWTALEHIPEYLLKPASHTDLDGIRGLRLSFCSNKTKNKGDEDAMVTFKPIEAIEKNTTLEWDKALGFAKQQSFLQKPLRLFVYYCFRCLIQVWNLPPEIRTFLRFPKGRTRSIKEDSPLSNWNNIWRRTPSPKRCNWLTRSVRKRSMTIHSLSTHRPDRSSSCVL